MEPLKDIKGTNYGQHCFSDPVVRRKALSLFLGIVLTTDRSEYACHYHTFLIETLAEMSVLQDILCQKNTGFEFCVFERVHTSHIPTGSFSDWHRVSPCRVQEVYQFPGVHSFKEAGETLVRFSSSQ